ncbi:hypothetical protein Kpho02_75670 [Kitasatospora phosalacinea]|uniref:Uncharacterized protein n=1 Tax=Kitasatospora phosalacinea TaxID=2065 RepID=A0A9W6QDN3_9ACTN|nr:hypothetical protein [Kitasatospora phosalacinea]GLW75270.1 hypothetical protein Kpho02_75670 [Kitasatospora phosalacinea]
MAGRYHVMADQERGGSWTFGFEQVERALLEAWPSVRVGGPVTQVGACELSVPVDGVEDPVELAYFAERRFFAFADQDPLAAPFRVVFTVLAALSPAAPVVWTTAWDATPRRVDLSVGLSQLLRPFES